MKTCHWRLIDTGSLDGTDNMAIDEALLSSFTPQISEPVLRLYGWQPAALSLGRFQKAEEVLDTDRCSHLTVPVVRRISGGGVIYHADELTYSIVCSPEQISPADSVKESFRILTGFLLEFYSRLGLVATYAVDSISERGTLGCRTAFCFAGKESFDIVVDGKKIGGNAQRRKKDLIFQHGSIPLQNRAAEGLEFMRDRNSDYARGAASLADCGISADVEVLKALLISSFERAMTVNVIPSALTDVEQQRYKYLAEYKYSSERWNLRGEES